MTKRKSDWSEYEKAWAWYNSDGLIGDNNLRLGTARCPWRHCKDPNRLLKPDEYGTDSDWSWVVDHMQPLSRGGTNETFNLQAMHNICNAAKGDSIY